MGGGIIHKTSVFFDFDNLAVHVKTALRTDLMCWNGKTAFRTMRQLFFLFVIVRTTGTGSGVTVFSLGDGHFT